MSSLYIPMTDKATHEPNTAADYNDRALEASSGTSSCSSPRKSPIIHFAYRSDATPPKMEVTEPPATECSYMVRQNICGCSSNYKLLSLILTNLLKRFKNGAVIAHLVIDQKYDTSRILKKCDELVLSCKCGYSYHYLILFEALDRYESFIATTEPVIKFKNQCKSDSYIVNCFLLLITRHNSTSKIAACCANKHTYITPKTVTFCNSHCSHLFKQYFNQDRNLRAEIYNSLMRYSATLLEQANVDTVYQVVRTLDSINE